MSREPNEQDDVRWLGQEHAIERLTAQIKALEAVVADYVLRYGLTDLARQILLETKAAQADSKCEER